MATGLHHICLGVSDINASLAFYDLVLPLMGFKSRKSEKSKAYVLGTSEIYLEEAESPTYAHKRFGVGIQHFACHADSRTSVDKLYEKLKDIRARIKDPPREYPEYHRNYYAVFFDDPDGITFEFCFSPGFEF